jgi:hypothetical protein
MRFFSLRRVKSDVVVGPLPAADTAKYLAAQGALWSLLFIPSPSSDAPIWWGFVAYPFVAVAGVFYCYRCNGGASGQRLAERYLAVGWVVLVRFLVLGMLLVMAGLVAAVVQSGLSGDESTFLDSPGFAASVNIGALSIEALMFWRIGVHIAEVRRASEPHS